MRLRVAVIAAVLVAVTAAPAAAATPTVSVAAGSHRPGQELVIRGSDWPSNADVHVVVCGNGGGPSSAACALEASVEVATTADGRFDAYLQLETPPMPCPCVVVATSGDTSARAPIDIAGAAYAPVQAIPERRALILTRARLVDGPSVGALFGTASTRRVRVVVTNGGDDEVRDVAVSAQVGRSRHPDGFVVPGHIDAIAPHQSVTVILRVPFPTVSAGTFRITGEAVSAGDAGRFSAKTTMVPWALIASVLLGIQAILLIWRNWVRRWLLKPQTART